MKNLVWDTINQYRNEIINCGDFVLNNPELGYKEFKTSDFIKSEFDKLGIEYQDGLAVTGIKARLKGRSSKVNICIIGEMDAIKCFGHPNCDPLTGAAHACGHNAQIAMMLGVAYALKKSGIMQKLDGDVTFMATPAEEFCELNYRESLKNKGKISCFGGKQELIRIGAFADVDIAMMIHSEAQVEAPNIYLNGSSLGFVAKQISFTGKAAHGSIPSEGINALNAAMLSLMGINANRETFKEEDKIRIHPIITNGGDLVNVIPDRVTIETYVRGATKDGIADACQKVDKAVAGGAMAIGANYEIKDLKGYEPLNQNKTLSRIFCSNALNFVKEENIFYDIDMVGSTDMGDLSNIMPVIQPTMGGYSGKAHSKDFKITDKEIAYITPAKILAATVIDLLDNGCENALKIVKG